MADCLIYYWAARDADACCSWLLLVQTTIGAHRLGIFRSCFFSVTLCLRWDMECTFFSKLRGLYRYWDVPGILSSTGILRRVPPASKCRYQFAVSDGLSIGLSSGSDEKNGPCKKSWIFNISQLTHLALPVNTFVLQCLPVLTCPYLVPGIYITHGSVPKEHMSTVSI